MDLYNEFFFHRDKGDMELGHKKGLAFQSNPKTKDSQPISNHMGIAKAKGEGCVFSYARKYDSNNPLLWSQPLTPEEKETGDQIFKGIQKYPFAGNQPWEVFQQDEARVQFFGQGSTHDNTFIPRYPADMYFNSVHDQYQMEQFNYGANGIEGRIQYFLDKGFTQPEAEAKAKDPAYTTDFFNQQQLNRSNLLNPMTGKPYRNNHWLDLPTLPNKFDVTNKDPYHHHASAFLKEAAIRNEVRSLISNITASYYNYTNPALPPNPNPDDGENSYYHQDDSSYGGGGGDSSGGDPYGNSVGGDSDRWNPYWKPDPDDHTTHDVNPEDYGKPNDLPPSKQGSQPPPPFTMSQPPPRIDDIARRSKLLNEERARAFDRGPEKHRDDWTMQMKKQLYVSDKNSAAYLPRREYHAQHAKAPPGTSYTDHFIKVSKEVDELYPLIREKEGNYYYDNERQLSGQLTDPPNQRFRFDWDDMDPDPPSNNTLSPSNKEASLPPPPPSRSPPTLVTPEEAIQVAESSMPGVEESIQVVDGLLNPLPIGPQMRKGAYGATTDEIFGKNNPRRSSRLAEIRQKAAERVAAVMNRVSPPDYKAKWEESPTTPSPPWVNPGPPGSEEYTGAPLNLESLFGPDSPPPPPSNLLVQNQQIDMDQAQYNTSSEKPDAILPKTSPFIENPITQLLHSFSSSIQGTINSLNRKHPDHKVNNLKFIPEGDVNNPIEVVSSKGSSIAVREITSSQDLTRDSNFVDKTIISRRTERRQRQDLDALGSLASQKTNRSNGYLDLYSENGSVDTKKVVNYLDKSMQEDDDEEDNQSEISDITERSSIHGGSHEHFITFSTGRFDPPHPEHQRALNEQIKKLKTHLFQHTGLSEADLYNIIQEETDNKYTTPAPTVTEYMVENALVHLLPIFMEPPREVARHLSAGDKILSLLEKKFKADPKEHVWNQQINPEAARLMLAYEAFQHPKKTNVHKKIKSFTRIQAMRWMSRRLLNHYGHLFKGLKKKKKSQVRKEQGNKGVSSKEAQLYQNTIMPIPKHGKKPIDPVKNDVRFVSTFTTIGGKQGTLDKRTQESLYDGPNMINREYDISLKSRKKHASQYAKALNSYL